MKRQKAELSKVEKYNRAERRFTGLLVLKAKQENETI